MSEHDEDAVVERIVHDLEIVGFRPIVQDAFAALKPGDRLPGGLVVMEDAAAKLMADAVAGHDRVSRETAERRAEIRQGARRSKGRFKL